MHSYSIFFRFKERFMQSLHLRHFESNKVSIKLYIHKHKYKMIFHTLICKQLSKGRMEDCFLFFRWINSTIVWEIRKYEEDCKDLVLLTEV